MDPFCSVGRLILLFSNHVSSPLLDFYSIRNLIVSCWFYNPSVVLCLALWLNDFHNYLSVLWQLYWIKSGTIH